MGQNAGCNFTRRTYKKLVEPSVDYDLSSDNIQLLNGGYKIGHTFNLSGEQINEGNTFTVRLVDNDKYDIEDYAINGSNANDLDPNIITSGGNKYLVLTFLKSLATVDISIVFFDNSLNDYVIFFYIVKK